MRIMEVVEGLKYFVTKKVGLKPYIVTRTITYENDLSNTCVLTSLVKKGPELE
jgi:hypothetical protein